MLFLLRIQTIYVCNQFRIGLEKVWQRHNHGGLITQRKIHGTFWWAVVGVIPAETMLIWIVLKKVFHYFISFKYALPLDRPSRVYSSMLVCLHNWSFSRNLHPKNDTDQQQKTTVPLRAALVEQKWLCRCRETDYTHHHPRHSALQRRQTQERVQYHD